MNKEELKLQREVKEWLATDHNGYTVQSLMNLIRKQTELKEKRIAELEKENAELLCQKNRNKSCYSCANATERCFRNEIGCPCDKYKSYKEENAELKEQNKNLQVMLQAEREVRVNEDYLKKITDLEAENEELKEDYEVLSCSVGDFGELQDKLEEEQRKNNGLSDNLTKAKELIKTLLLIADNKVSQMEFQLCVADAEQFLKDKAEQEEPCYVIMNMNCQYEICRKCPKSGLFKGTYEECENWIKEKLSEVEK